MPAGDRAVRKDALSAAAYAGMFVFGIVMALLGAVLPVLSERLAFRISDIGVLFLVMNFAMLVCSLVLGAAMDRYGMKPPLAGGPLLVAVALTLIARATEWNALLPAVLLLGIGGGALNGGTNTLVADLHDEPRAKSAALNRLGIFFGFGALILPFTMGALLARLGIEALLLTAAVLCVVTGVSAALLRFPAPKQERRPVLAGMPRFLRSRFVLLTAFLLFFQSGVEFTMGGYISTYLTRASGLSVAAASWVLAAYWAALMVARAVLSSVVLGAEPRNVVSVSAACACAAALLPVFSTSRPVAVSGILLAGLALSGIFPTVLGIAGSRYPEHSGTVFGILFTVALSGGMTLPWAAAQVAEAAGLRYVFAVVAFAFACILLLSRAAFGEERYVT